MTEWQVDTDEVGALEFQAHIYDDGRCIYCDVNDLDDGIYGPFECIKREQFTYTTETPEKRNPS